jgi:carboxyl-terminal processing protease
MFKKIKERKFHLLTITFLLGLFLGMNFSFLISAEEPSYKYLDYFHKIYQIVKSDYVDKPATKDLFYGAIRGMIKALDDPYTRFLDEDSFSQLQEMTTGKFVGVGIVITHRDDHVVVISPIEDSPAIHSGILSGDIILKVNKKKLKGLKLHEVVKLIKGLPESNVKLTIEREGYDENMIFNLKRVSIKIKSVEYSILDNSEIGYLKIKTFNADTTNDITKALKYFNKKEIKKIIVDLRNNPGGLLTASIDISDLFLKKGLTIVSTRGRKGHGKERYYKSENDPLYSGKLLLLVNNGSASASEIVSGALRDNNRSKLIGEKTFGKGSVQKSFNLDKNIGVAVTIAKYYTPSGVCIHKKGIKPDYKVLVEKFSKDEIKNIKILNKKKLLKKIVTKKSIYNEELKTSFMKILKDNSILLSMNTSNFILKREINRYKKRALYDLEFDNQLNKAIKYISQ